MEKQKAIMNQKEQYLLNYLKEMYKESGINIPLEDKLIAIKQDRDIIEMRNGRYQEGILYLGNFFFETGESISFEEYKLYLHTYPAIIQRAFIILYTEIILKQYIKETIIEETVKRCNKEHPMNIRFNHSGLENVLRNNIQQISENKNSSLSKTKIDEIVYTNGTLFLPSQLIKTEIYTTLEEYQKTLSPEIKDLFAIYGFYCVSEKENKQLDKLVSTYLINVQSKQESENPIISTYHASEVTLLKKIEQVLNISSTDGTFMLANVLFNGKEGKKTLIECIDHYCYTTISNKIKFKLQRKSIGEYVIRQIENLENLSITNSEEKVKELESLFADPSKIKNNCEEEKILKILKKLQNK